MYNNFMKRDISIYFMMIIEGLLNYFDDDDYIQYKKYEASIHDEFVLL